jgi:hypothetical protein
VVDIAGGGRMGGFTEGGRAVGEELIEGMRTEVSVLTRGLFDK